MYLEIEACYLAIKCANRRKMKIDIAYIKNNYPIVDIAMKLGIEVLNNNMCKCPFHKGGQEKNASMSLHVYTNRYKCFACDAKGNNIDLVMRTTNCSFMKAIEFITGNNYTAKSKQSSYSSSKETKAIAMINATTKAKPIQKRYHDVDVCSSDLLDDREALNYLASRNINKEVASKYQIKNLPTDYNSQGEILKQLQTYYSDSKLVESGLYGFGTKTNNLYNKFYKHRLIICYIADDKIISLQGRCIDSNLLVKSKYLYLQGNATAVYNLDILNNLKAGEDLIICEGVIDCLSWHTLGKHAIAIGSACNVSKLDKDILAKLTKLNIYIAGDNDRAGKAMNKSLTKMLDNNNITKYYNIDLPSITKSFHVKTHCKDINDILQAINIENLGNYKYCKYQADELYFFGYGTISKSELDNITSSDDLELILKFKQVFNNIILLAR